MVNSYAKAYTEVLEIISHLSNEEYNKIPKEKINFYNANKDNNYIFKINPNLDLYKQNISSEANAILVSLFRDYFANENQQKILDDLLIENQKKSEEKKYGFNADEVFKINIEDSYNIEQKEEILPIPVEEVKWYSKILEFLKKLFVK